MIYISIGSNVGNKLQNLRRAASLIKARCLTEVETSIVLETAAILPPDAPSSWNQPYFNMVIRGISAFSPPELLEALKTIEQEMGRQLPAERWSPRIIDLDILIWDEKIVQTPSLKIPHPELFHRLFLLHLMAMLDPDFIYDVKDNSAYTGKTFGEIAYNTRDINTCFKKSLVLNPQLVGIVNVTPDSFSDGGLHFSPDQAILQVQRLDQEGACVIELGAQSTRHGAISLNPQQEYGRLQPVLEGISGYVKDHGITLSIDTFSPEVILKLIKHYPVSWINDVTGTLDQATLAAIAEAGCKLVVMHSLEVPANKARCIDFNISPIQTMCNWAEKTVHHLKNCGFKEDAIILDPGIGFGKSAWQDVSLLKDIHLLKKYGCPILVGHSQKSYLSSFYQSHPAERDLETIAVSHNLFQKGVDYLRVHNVADHQRFFVASKIVNGESHA